AKDDVQAVQAAAVALYRPWLEQSAVTFASALGGSPPPQPAVATAKPEKGCAWLFVDALRYDVALRLQAMLEAAGAAVTIGAGWAAFPALTPTSKPAASPIAGRVSRASTLHDFAPETE